MNDTDREQWIANDEYLYLEAKRYRGGMRGYLRAHRKEIDAMITATLEGDRQPHTGPTGGYLI